MNASYTQEQWMLAVQIETAYEHFAALLRAYKHFLPEDSPTLLEVNTCLEQLKSNALWPHLWEVRRSYEGIK